MKAFYLPLMLMLFFRQAPCQKPAADLSLPSLKEICSQAVEIDNLCSKNKLLTISEDGDLHDCTSYYKNAELCLKEECNDYSGIIDFQTIDYPHLKNSSSLSIISVCKEGVQSFKMYLICVKSEQYELVILGNRNDYSEQIEKIKDDQRINKL